jgi:hypothetical protein
MKKDIEIPIAKEVYVALIHEANEEFLDREWNAYILNNRATAIDMVMVVSNGFDTERKTSTMRHVIGELAAKSFKKIEVVQEDVLTLNNEFFVTYYADSKLYEKRFIFESGSVSIGNLSPIPILEQDGILRK